LYSKRIRPGRFIKIVPDDIVPSGLVCEKSAFKIFKFCKYWDIFSKEYGSAFRIELVVKKTTKSGSLKKNFNHRNLYN